MVDGFSGELAVISLAAVRVAAQSRRRGVVRGSLARRWVMNSSTLSDMNAALPMIDVTEDWGRAFPPNLRGRVRYALLVLVCVDGFSLEM